jgi:hypothetical protein
MSSHRDRSFLRVPPLLLFAAAGALAVGCAVPTPDGWVQSGDTASESSGAAYPPLDAGVEIEDAGGSAEGATPRDGGCGACPRIVRAMEQRKQAASEADGGADGGLKDAGTTP